MNRVEAKILEWQTLADDLLAEMKKHPEDSPEADRLAGKWGFVTIGINSLQRAQDSYQEKPTVKNLLFLNKVLLSDAAESADIQMREYLEKELSSGKYTKNRGVKTKGLLHEMMAKKIQDRKRRGLPAKATDAARVLSKDPSKQKTLRNQYAKFKNKSK